MSQSSFEHVSDDDSSDIDMTLKENLSDEDSTESDLVSDEEDSLSDEEDSVSDEDSDLELEDEEEDDYDSEADEEILQPPVFLPKPRQESEKLWMDVLMMYCVVIVALIVSGEISKVINYVDVYNGLYLDSSKQNWTMEKLEMETQGDMEIRAQEYAMALSKGIEAFNKKSFADQLLTNHWEPLNSRFVGVEEYLNKIWRLNSSLHEFMYMAKPRFYIQGNEILMKYEFQGEEMEKNFADGKFCFNCLKSEWIVENGVLTVKENYTSWFKAKEFTRVYYVPSAYLISLIV
uniref:P4Hc domain-containing protein n=1 Tax=Caenorhabditis tropicalis TaxID=1561998 RepID=A0A1I7V2R4_9PELO